MVLDESARPPFAVLLFPVVLAYNAWYPVAVLKRPKPFTLSTLFEFPAPAPQKVLPAVDVPLFVSILPAFWLNTLIQRGTSSVVPIKFIAVSVPVFPVKLHALLLPNTYI